MTDRHGRPGHGRALQSYDPVEVQLIRDQIDGAGIEADDALLLSTLQARDDCRVIKAALDALARGDTDGLAVQALYELSERNLLRNQPYQADFFQTVVDHFALGDTTPARRYHEANCGDVT